MKNAEQDSFVSTAGGEDGGSAGASLSLLRSTVSISASSVSSGSDA